MDWWSLAALSALFLGLYDVAKKAALNQNSVLLVLFLCSLTGSLLLLVAATAGWTLGGRGPQGEWSLVALSARQHALIVAKACIVTLSWVLSFFAIKHLPISLGAPIRATAPLFTIAGAIALFGERPSLRQWLGILAILLAYWAYSLISRAEGIRFTRSRWVALLFAGTLVGAASGLYDKVLLQHAHLPPFTLQFWFTLYGTALQGCLVLLAKRAGLRSGSLQWRWTIPAVGTALLVADQLYFRALSNDQAMLSVVSVIRRSNVIVSFSLGALLFRERFRRRKALVLLVVLGGVALLV